MSGSGGSNRSSSRTTTNNQYNTNNWDGAGNTGLQAFGEGNTINVLDGNAIDRSFNFAESGLKVVNNSLEGAMSFGQEALENVTQSNKKAVEQLANFSQDSFNELANTAQLFQSQGQKDFNKIFIYMIIAFVVIFGLFMIFRKR